MLKGRTAAITGGASGIGEAAARLFVKEGARVVIGDVQVERAQAIAAELGAASCLAVACDVTREEDVQKLVDTAVSTFGQLDIMVNNAGVVGKLGTWEALIENAPAEEFDRVIDVNLRGVLLGTKHAARAMKLNAPPAGAACRGAIINVASVASFRVNVANGPEGAPHYIPAGYCASKSGVVSLTKLAACELAPYGIRVNAVAPGSTATPMVKSVTPGMEKGTLEDLERMMAASSPLAGIVLKPQDIANGMLYLASDMGRCVNGHTLTIDLGNTAGVAGMVPALATAAAS